MVNPVGQVAYSPTRVYQQTLTKEDFLRLFAAQMANQNPLEPMSSSEFLGQLAQFTLLETMVEISGKLEELRRAQYEAQLADAVSLIGKVVEVQDEDGREATGLVESVVMSDGEPHIVVGDQQYPLSSVRRVWIEEEV